MDQERTGTAALCVTDASFSLTRWQHVTFLREMMMSEGAKACQSEPAFYYYIP